MKFCEKSARTQEEAIEEALKELNASITDVDIQVLDEGSKGLFGLFGSRLARVKVTLKNATEEESLLEALEKEVAPQTEEKPSTDKPQPAKEEKKAASKPAQVPVSDESSETVKEMAAAEDAAEVPAEKISETRRPEPVRRTRGQGKAHHEERKEKPAPAAKAEAPKPEIKPLEKPIVTPIPDDQLTDDTLAGTAKAFLKELTQLMGVQVEIAMGSDEEGNLYAQMTGDTLGILIGRRGETLDALQYLTSLKINRNQDTYTRITLDTENYREKREDTLVRLANRMANRAVKTGRKVSLEPMNPYERRIIHSALQANEKVDTHSEGEDQNRHVVITLVK